VPVWNAHVSTVAREVAAPGVERLTTGQATLLWIRRPARCADVARADIRVGPVARLIQLASWEA
jgi:hypothetical protein